MTWQHREEETGPGYVILFFAACGFAAFVLFTALALLYGR